MKRGKAFIVTGLLCIAAALVLVFYNYRDSKRAKAASEALLEALLPQMETDPVPSDGRMRGRDDMEYPDYVLNPDMELPQVVIDGTAFVGTLTVPGLEFTFPVCAAWDYDRLKVAPCRYSGTPYKDNFVICAHNYIDQFGRLTDLSYGDEISFTDNDGNTFSYQVREIIVLPPTAIEEMISKEWDLTLFTCTHGGAARITLRAEAV